MTTIVRLLAFLTATAFVTSLGAFVALILSGNDAWASLGVGAGVAAVTTGAFAMVMGVLSE